MKESGSQDAHTHSREEEQHSKLKPKSSASEREKTKLRERHRRSITTKIFNGLRKYGGYNLPPRADINDVLRCLASEAGWIVEPDGTTYRAQGLAQASGNHSLSPMRQQAAPVKTSLTPSSSFGGGSMGGFNCSIPGITADNIDMRGGDCSTTASPRHIGMQQPSNNSSLSLLQSSALSSPFASPASSEGGPGGQLATHFIPGMSSGYLPSGGRERELSLSLMKDDVAAYFSADTLEARDLVTSRNNMVPNPGLLMNANMSGMRYGVRGTLPSVMMLSQQHPFLQESRASNQNTPIGSPQRHGGTA